MGKMTHQYKLANPYIFWSIIIVLLLITFSLNQYLSSNMETNTVEAKKVDSTIVEKSYKQNNAPIEVDLDNMTHMDYENQTSTEESGSVVPNFIHNNLNMFLLILYTVALALLFIYREKQNRLQRQYMEQLEDEMKIKLAKQAHKTYLYESIEGSLLKHKSSLEPYLSSTEVKKYLTTDVNYILINARIVLEKTMLKLYKYYFKEEATLNDMMYQLFKKRVITPSMNNYAHIVKAYGNKAIHPNLNNTTPFETQEALLVMSSLLQFIEELQSVDLPEKKDV